MKITLDATKHPHLKYYENEDGSKMILIAINETKCCVLHDFDGDRENKRYFGETWYNGSGRGLEKVLNEPITLENDPKTIIPEGYRLVTEEELDNYNFPSDVDVMAVRKNYSASTWCNRKDIIWSKSMRDSFLIAVPVDYKFEDITKKKEALIKKAQELLKQAEEL